MARLFVAASTQYLEHAAAPVTTTPLTLAAWARCTNTTAPQTILCVSNSATTGDGWYLQCRGDLALDPVTAGTGAAGSFSEVSSSVGYSSGVWCHVAGTYASATNRTVYLNGGNSATSVNSRAPSGPNRVAVGRFTRSASINYFEGRVAEAGIWAAVLTAAEILALSRGVPPWRIRPTALVGYWPLWGLATHATEPDLTANGRDLTITGATFATHAPVLPRRIRWPESPGLAEAGAIIPLSVAGAVALSGAVRTSTQQLLSGTLPSAGSSPGEATRLLQGLLAASGSVRGQVVTVQSGILSPLGTLLRGVMQGATGSVGSIGSLGGAGHTLLTGSLASVGVLTTVQVILLVLTGLLGSTGSVVQTLGKGLSGHLSALGVLNNVDSRHLSGLLVPVGAHARAVSHMLSGLLGLAGSLALLAPQVLLLTGSVALAGGLVHSAAWLRTGSTAASGVVRASIGWLRSGVLSSAGSLLSGSLLSLLTQGVVGLSGALNMAVNVVTVLRIRFGPATTRASHAGEEAVNASQFTEEDII